MALAQPMFCVRLMVVWLVLDVREERSKLLDDVSVVGPHIGEVTKVVGDLREPDVFLAALGPQPLDLITHGEGLPPACCTERRRT